MQTPTYIAPQECVKLPDVFLRNETYWSKYIKTNCCILLDIVYFIDNL